MVHRTVLSAIISNGVQLQGKYRERDQFRKPGSPGSLDARLPADVFWASSAMITSGKDCAHQGELRGHAL